MRRRFAFPAFALLFFLSLFIAGCWPFAPEIIDNNGNGGNGGGELLERTSPENVLNNLKTIYSDKDYVVNSPEDAHSWAEKYRELFHPGGGGAFKFHFLPKDNPDLALYPDSWWGLEGEVGGFEALLNHVVSGRIQNISLEWTVTPAKDDNRVDGETGLPINPGGKWIHVTSVLLEVLDVQEAAVTYRVPGVQTDFYFSPDPSDSTLWVITEWFDRES